MRLVALVEATDHVCCRYRLAAFQRAFAAAGFQLELQKLPKHPVSRLAIGAGLHEASAVIVQRKLLPTWTVALLRRRVQRLIFDFDDAVWLRDSYSPRGFVDARRASRFGAIVSASDLIVAGNDYLAAEAAKYTSPEKVIVIPTCVEPADYPVASHDRSTGVQLVWVGSASTLRGLERFTETLSLIGRAIPAIRLKLICDQFLQIPDLPIDRCLWRRETEAAEIAAADIGISWIPDDPWSRGKCGLKILQYQAAGLPVAANPVGVHPQLVQNGVTGLTATTQEDWIGCIRRLAESVAMRTQMGINGRSQVERKYSVEAGARNWLTTLDRLSGLVPLRKSG